MKRVFFPKHQTRKLNTKSSGIFLSNPSSSPNALTGAYNDLNGPNNGLVIQVMPFCARLNDFCS